MDAQNLPFDRAEVDGTVDARFRRVAARQAGSVAVVDGAVRLTYGELDAWSDRLAAAIQAVDATPGPVALLLPHGHLAVVGIYGALKAGKCYAPLALGQAVEMNQRFYATADAPLLVTVRAEEAAAQAVTAGRGAILWLDDLPAAPLQPPPPRDGHAPAAVLFTSGSTGRPKGVIKTHGMVLLHTYQSNVVAKLTCADRVSYLNAYTAGSSQHALFHSLLTGGSLAAIDPRQLTPATLDAWLRETAITLLVGPPALLRLYFDWLPPHGGPPRVRLIRLIGQAIVKEDVIAFQRGFGPGCVLVNRYGISETGGVTQFAVDHTTQLVGRSVPVGYPYVDRRVVIVDEALQPLPVGEIGEITVRGPYLSAGYWGESGLSDAAFPTDPATGERFYRSGDLGRLQPDGRLEHLGRKDHMVKVRGYRVELGAVEAVLRELPGVVDAAVVAVNQADGDVRLVAYYTAGPGAAPTVSALRRGVLAHLPGYMVPAVFVPVAAFPLTHSGKIDRLRLPAPDGRRPALDVPYLPPRTPLEARLAGLWAGLLQIDRVGLYDDLFDLGGNSLLAAQAVSALREELGIELPLRYVFDGPTVAELAARISVDRERRAPVAPPGVTTLRGGDDGAPLFVVPGGNGGEEELLLFARLAHEMGLSRSVHGLLAHGQDGVTAPHPNVTEMATAYVASIRRVQPQGPYWVVGECIGGGVAFEVARRLAAEGATVAQLILMDARLPSPAGQDQAVQAAGTAVVVGRQVVAWWGRLRHQAAHVSSRERVAFLATKLKRQVARLGEAPERMARRLVANATYRELASHYQPTEPYAGEVTFLMSAQWAAEGLLARWQPLLTGRVHALVVPGSHNDYLGAHVSSTAAALAARLRDVQAAV